MWTRLKSRGPRPSPATVMAFLALVFAMGGFAVAASIPDKGGVIHACYNTSGSKKGLLRVTKKDKCAKGEKALAFNQKGQQGAQGAQGPGGPAGPGGSDAQFNGAQAGGALTGTYPSPSLASPESVHVVGAAGQPAFAAGASNDGSSVSTGFYKDGFGIVHVQGTVGTGSPSADVFILPAGYRPAEQQCVAAPAFLANTTTFTTNRLCVAADGRVVNNRGTGVRFVSLDGLSFRATQ